MSDKPENEIEYNKRKVIEIRHLLDTCIDHPELIAGIKITDAMVNNPIAKTKTPLLLLQVDVNESLLNKLKEKK